MKWAADGELTPLDLLEVLERLAEADRRSSGLLDCPTHTPEAGGSMAGPPP